MNGVLRWMNGVPRWINPVQRWMNGVLRWMNGVPSDWILRYLKNEVDNANITILDNPQDVNLAGLKWLEVATDKE